MPKKGLLSGKTLKLVKSQLDSPFVPGPSLGGTQGGEKPRWEELPVWEPGPHEKENSEEAILAANTEYNLRPSVQTRFRG